MTSERNSDRPNEGSREGDLSMVALDQLADELFVALDSEEAASGDC